MKIYPVNFIVFCITGIHADGIHTLLTALFLWFLSETMLEKLDRVKVKYGLLDNQKDT